MDGPWIWEQLIVSPVSASLWLALSFLLAVVSTLAAKTVAPGLERPVRIARWVLVPYLGLLLGGLSPRAFGLSDLDWAAGLKEGVVILAGLVALLALIRLGIEGQRREPALHPRRSVRALPFQAVENAAREFHWCFLRGAAWEILLAMPFSAGATTYWAVWLAAALALPGIFFHPGPHSDKLISTLILGSTAGLFFLTRNFWLCLLLHLCLRAILQWRRPAA